MPNPFLPQGVAPNSGGVFVKLWMDFFTNLAGQIISLTTIVNSVPGVNTFTVATQPSLGLADAGYLGFVSEYNHTIRWDGAAWQFWGGDNNGYFADLAIVPQSPGWQLCDGTVSKYLTLGATLTETAFTTPNLTGTPAYKKAAAAYTGTINAKSGSTAASTTGIDVTGTGTTGDELAHTHGAGSYSANAIPFNGGQATAGVTAGFTAQFNPESVAIIGTSGAGSAHHHSVPALTVPGLAIPNLGVDTIDMEHLNVLPYFRR